MSVNNTRPLPQEAIVGRYKSVEDFKRPFVESQKEIYKDLLSSNIITKEEFDESSNNIFNKLDELFVEGDEILHCDDFGIAPKLCGREAIVIQRGTKMITVSLLRMS